MKKISAFVISYEKFQATFTPEPLLIKLGIVQHRIPFSFKAEFKALTKKQRTVINDVLSFATRIIKAKIVLGQKRVTK